MYTREQERESIAKTVAAFEQVLGEKPTGYLSPGHSSTPHTLELVAEQKCFRLVAEPAQQRCAFIRSMRRRA